MCVLADIWSHMSNCYNLHIGSATDLYLAIEAVHNYSTYTAAGKNVSGR